MEHYLGRTHWMSFGVHRMAGPLPSSDCGMQLCCAFHIYAHACSSEYSLWSWAALPSDYSGYTLKLLLWSMFLCAGQDKYPYLSQMHSVIYCGEAFSLSLFGVLKQIGKMRLVLWVFTNWTAKWWWGCTAILVCQWSIVSVCAPSSLIQILY